VDGLRALARAMGGENAELRARFSRANFRRSNYQTKNFELLREGQEENGNYISSSIFVTG
jgi:hypothetical protein